MQNDIYLLHEFEIQNCGSSDEMGGCNDADACKIRRRDGKVWIEIIHNGTVTWAVLATGQYEKMLKEGELYS